MPKPVSARPVPKLRSASTMGRRPRPKTIHVDQDADLNQALGSNRGSRGSTSNMSGRLFRPFNAILFLQIFGFLSLCCPVSFLFVCLFTARFPCIHLLCVFFPFLHCPFENPGLPRSESRNSINDLHDGGPTTPSRHHLGLSAMGTGRSNRPVSRPTSRPPSRGPSRRGSTQYLNEEPSNGTPPRYCT